MIVRDPGLQPQRTALAWERTSLALVVNALIVLRAGAIQRQRLLLAMGVLLLVIAASGIVFAACRRRHLDDGAAPASPHPVALLIAAIATWLACAIQAAGMVWRT